VEAIELFQDLAILGVMTDGDDVLVDVYGGRDNVCANVRFTFAEPRERASSVARLRRWQVQRAALSLVVQGDRVQLLSERALFERALESSSAE
jgi:hypothetical protein